MSAWCSRRRSRRRRLAAKYDNFTYPRHALDFAILRVYKDGQPLRPAYFLHLADKPVGEGEFVPVLGHPGSTSRGLTMTQLKTHRDVQNPLQLSILAARRQALFEIRRAQRGGGIGRRGSLSAASITSVSASSVSRPACRALKVLPANSARSASCKRSAEAARACSASTAMRGPRSTPPTASCRRTASASPTARLRRRGSALWRSYFRYPSELKTSAEAPGRVPRLRLPSLRIQLLSAAPVYPELEEAMLGDWLQAQAALGAEIRSSKRRSLATRRR